MIILLPPYTHTEYTKFQNHCQGIQENEILSTIQEFNCDHFGANERMLSNQFDGCTKDTELVGWDQRDEEIRKYPVAYVNSKTLDSDTVIKDIFDFKESLDLFRN